MSKTVRVEVTAEDIAAGKKRSAFHCPLATALTRATGTRCGVSDRVHPRDATTYPLPEKALAWRRDFDAGKPVEPFIFRVPA